MVNWPNNKTKIMNDLDKVISAMDFQYFGTGQHKMPAEKFLATENAVLLDVRAREEIETVKLAFTHHCQVLEIPTEEIPLRLDEIPTDKTIGVFCSAGVRAAIIFAYLKSKGFPKARIITGGYPALMEAILPGKLYKTLHQ